MCFPPRESMRTKHADDYLSYQLSADAFHGGSNTLQKTDVIE